MTNRQMEIFREIFNVTATANTDVKATPSAKDLLAKQAKLRSLHLETPSPSSESEARVPDPASIGELAGMTSKST